MAVSQDLCAQVVFGETGILRAPGGDEDQLAAGRRFIAGVIYARYEGHETRFAPPQKPTSNELADQTIKKHWGLCQQAASLAISDNVGTCRHFVVSWLNDAGDGPSPDDPAIQDPWPINEKARITKKFGPFTRLHRQDLYILKYCGVALRFAKALTSHEMELERYRTRDYKSFPCVAAVAEDGEFLVLSPEGAPQDRSYRIHRDDVEVVSASHSLRDSQGSRLYLNLRLQKHAECALVQTGVASSLIHRYEPSSDSLLISSMLQVSIDFKSNGEGSLQYGGTSVPCLGKPGQQYPTDQIIENIEGIQYVGDYGNAFKFKRWVSSQFNDPQGNPAIMLWSVKIDGSRGIFIHGDPDSLAANGGPSAGCVHLSSLNAERFYNWLTARTRIQIGYPW